MRAAAFKADGAAIVPPTTLDVAPAARYAHLCASAAEARIVAMLAAGLARPTDGNVLIGEYDPRVQPVHCKRIAGFVPHDPLVIAPSEFSRYITYRAALWGIDQERARAHASLLLERLHGIHEAFAYPIVAALIPMPRLLVMDRPQPAYAASTLAAAGACALFSTHIDMQPAAAYSGLREVAHA